MLKRYSLSQSDCQCRLGDFYENAAKKLGKVVTEKTLYDCRRICITKPVQACLWAYLSEQGYTDGQIAALMLQYGPKANLDGDEFEFTAEDGFVSEGD